MSIENPINSNTEKNLPGFEEHERKYSLEDAINEIDSTLDSAEQQFFDKFGQKPNLFDENDYVRLGELLDLDRKNQEAMEQYKKGSSMPFSPSQYCFRLIRRFLERQGYFLEEKQKIFLDAFLGRTEWGGNPKREKDYRLSAIKELIERDVPFPADNFEYILKDLEKISQTCILSETCKSDKELFKIGNRIGHHMVNPAGYTLRYLKGISNYKDLTDRINQVEYMFGKNLNFVQFK